ncbi:hypothetical protein [Streptomyces sp. NPDC055036]
MVPITPSASADNTNPTSAREVLFQPMRDACYSPDEATSLIEGFRVGVLREVTGADTVEYDIAVQDDEMSDEENLDPTTDRREAEGRLTRYRDMHPEARLVQRTVSYGTWTEAS